MVSEKSGRLEKNIQKLSLRNDELLKVLELMDEEEKQTVGTEFFFENCVQFGFTGNGG